MVRFINLCKMAESNKDKFPAKVEIHVWQSRIEIEYYSVAYFERITEFDTL